MLFVVKLFLPHYDEARVKLSRLLLRALLGRRLPVTNGERRVPGLRAPVSVRRDRFGVPMIEADNDADAWFGLGFCHGQDRALQLEMYLRLVRGTLAELVGPFGLPFDRISRRVGFRRAAEQQLPLIDPALRPHIDSYVAGINAGHSVGLPRRPHEFVLLRSRPTPWDAADPLAFLKLQSFLMASNWDVELARLRILRADGPEALAALDPGYAPWLPVTDPPGTPAGTAPAVERLTEELEVLARCFGTGGGSNNWVIAGRRTASGRPLVANDPHLIPVVPSQWYLAQVRTPEWGLAGATLVGTPTFPAGHNGRAAWGVTAGLLDNTDLFLEELRRDADGWKYRQGDSFLPCGVRRETIAVRGSAPVVEEVLSTPRGPILSPALEGVHEALSLRAVWLDPLPLSGWLEAHRAPDFGHFRRCFAEWPGLPQNIVYADTYGTIGWQTAGQCPRRRRGNGGLPLPGWDPANGWDGLVPFDEMAYVENPPAGFVATANNRPRPEGDGPFLGNDFLEGYRLAVIADALGGSAGWDRDRCTALQLNLSSRPWAEMREIVLAVQTNDPDALRARELLRDWDGAVSADSPAATVYELFVASMARRLAQAKAPKSWERVLGKGFSTLTPHNFFCFRRASHLVSNLREQPEGWFAGGWTAEVAAALAEAVAYLRAEYGPSPRAWAWGTVRPLVLGHVLFGRVRAWRRVFNLGPVPWGGDDNTVGQASVLPLEPLSPAHNAAGLRAVFDVGAWSECRFGVAGGQSGNVLSPHYEDLFPLWRRGEGVPIAWTPEEVQSATRTTLRLLPG